jgi:hypothetical protein
LRESPQPTLTQVIVMTRVLALHKAFKAVVKPRKPK